MTNLLFYVLPVIFGVLITVFLLNSNKLPSQSGSNNMIKRSYRFGSGEFFDPIAEIYDITNRIMVCMP